MNPRVSVIIPYYNSGKYIEAALNSIRAQNYAPLEIILVDDGSADDIAQRAKEWPDVVFLQQPNKGPAAARNAGLKRATGEIIAFLDADDRWPENKLTLQLARLRQDPELMLVTGRIQYIYLEGVPEDWILFQENHTLMHVHLGAALVRREVFDQTGLFDETMRLSEDQDWSLRLRELNIKMSIMKEVTLLYTRHPKNMTRGASFQDFKVLETLKRSIDRRRVLHGGAPQNMASFTSHDEARPLVSVILPVYNGETYLRETVESVLAQSYAPLELLAVDDGSKDGSLNILRGFGDRITVIAQENQGVAAARNAALRRARGEFIAMIDQDDLWNPEKIALEATVLRAYPHLDYVLSRQKFFLQEGTPCPAWMKPELLEGDYAGYVFGAFLARKSVFDKTGGLETDYRNTDDVSWFFRAKDMGLAMRHLPHIGLYKRVHGANNSAAVKRLHGELLQIVKTSIARQKEKKADAA